MIEVRTDIAWINKVALIEDDSNAEIKLINASPKLLWRQDVTAPRKTVEPWIQLSDNRSKQFEFNIFAKTCRLGAMTRFHPSAKLFGR